MRLQTSTVAFQVTYLVVAQRVLPNRNVFDTMLQFNGLAGLPSYLQRSCCIPKHIGKHFKTDQVENQFFTASH